VLELDCTSQAAIARVQRTPCARAPERSSRLRVVEQRTSIAAVGRVVHVAAMRHPTQAWATQRLRNAAIDRDAPALLLRDR